MFILYAVVAGLVVGLMLGGRLESIAETRFRWGWLAIHALTIQLVLFSPLAGGLGEASPWIYVGSTMLVVAVVLANVRLPGLPIVLVGALSNLAAIVANGGSMPASAAALDAVGGAIHGGPTNSILVAHPALEPLTDIFAMPAWIPFANIFSVGDVLIGMGVAVAIAAAMRPSAGGPDDPARIEGGANRH
jgi:hypothetical protein